MILGVIKERLPADVLQEYAIDKAIQSMLRGWVTNLSQLLSSILLLLPHPTRNQLARKPG